MQLSTILVESTKSQSDIFFSVFGVLGSCNRSMILINVCCANTYIATCEYEKLAMLVFTLNGASTFAIIGVEKLNVFSIVSQYFIFH